jgi:hypothetical protein
MRGESRCASLFSRLRGVCTCECVSKSHETHLALVSAETKKGVALDKSTHKYRLLQIVNGQAKTVGRFHVEKEGIEGYNAYNDMQTKGPLGVTGVPASIGNIGPPGERPFLRSSSWEYTNSEMVPTHSVPRLSCLGHCMQALLCYRKWIGK